MKPPPAGMAATVVNWNTRDLLRRCLDSVLANEPAEVVVVDNGSTDGSAEMVRERFPGVRLIVLSGNPGYGGGCNAGIRATASDYVMVLNSDTVLRPGALRALTQVLDEVPRAALVGPRVVNADGSPQRSCYPFPSAAARLLIHEPFASVAALVPAWRERYVPRWRERRTRPVPWVLGAAFAVRRCAFEEVGGFDETFEMYFEEVDLAWRLRARGWDTLFAPVTEVVHLGGASTRQRRAAMLARYELSLMRFYRRHRRGAGLRLALAIVRGQAATRYARALVAARMTRDPDRRARLAEDVAAWRAVIADAANGP